MAISPHLETLIDAAANQRQAILFYRKSVRSAGLKPRLIEPYKFVEGKQDLMIHAFQITHGGDHGEAGWRFFMAHKIDQAAKTHVKFVPRRPITLPTGEVKFQHELDENWASEGRREYRDCVGDAIADGELEPGELFDLEGIKQKHKLTTEDVRFVHAAVYHRCLGAIVQDGMIDDEEVKQLQFLQKAMRQLGWAPGD